MPGPQSLGTFYISKAIMVLFLRDMYTQKIMKQALVTVDKLVKLYGSNKVVKGVSFEVARGEIFGILGPNGAGKTTTLEMMEAMRPIDGGSVVVDGIDVAKHPQRVKEIIGVQPQTAAFEEKTKLTELLRFFASTYGRKVNPIELLEHVQLEEKAASYPERLSGGQRQRFSIAAALVNNPRVLFLDEPTTGLDPQSRRNLWELIQRIRDDGVTIIMTTHYMEEAQLLCDRVAIMDDGAIIALDSPKQLISDLLGRGFKKKVQVEQADLEDVFIDLTGKELRE